MSTAPSSMGWLGRVEVPTSTKKSGESFTVSYRVAVLVCRSEPRVASCAVRTASHRAKRGSVARGSLLPIPEGLRRILLSGSPDAVRAEVFVLRSRSLLRPLPLQEIGGTLLWRTGRRFSAVSAPVGFRAFSPSDSAPLLIAVLSGSPALRFSAYPRRLHAPLPDSMPWLTLHMWPISSARHARRRRASQWRPCPTNGARGLSRGLSPLRAERWLAETACRAR